MRPRKVIRQRVLHSKVTRMAAHKGQDAAGPQKLPSAALIAYDRAGRAVSEDLCRMQDALSTRVLPGRAAENYCSRAALASHQQPGPELTARQAYELLGSVSGALNRVSASRNPNLNRFSDRQHHPKHPSAPERLFTAIDSAIPLAKVHCAAGAQSDALNGAGAANLLANMVQGPTRIELISRNILDLAREVEALAPPDTPASVESLERKTTTLKAMVREAQGFHVAMQAKVMALAKVADQAIGVLSKDAQKPKLKKTDRDEIRKAVTICTAFKWALDDLGRAYAHPGWVYAELDRLTAAFLPTSAH